MKKKAKHPGKTPITYKKKPKTPAQPGSGPAKDVPAAQLPPDRAHRKAPVRDLKALRLDEGFRLVIEALTPMHLGSGQADVNVDADIVYDAYGLPVFPAKRLKGLLYESGIEVAEMAERAFPELLQKDSWDALFHHGMSQETKEAAESSQAQLILRDLALQDAEAMEQDWAYLERRYPSLFQPHDILASYTSLRYQTRIDPETGIAADTSLHNMRVLEAGCTFAGTIVIEHGTMRDWKMVALALRNLSHAGLKRTRGFGRIDCRLEQDDRDATALLVEAALKKGTC